MHGSVTRSARIVTRRIDHAESARPQMRSYRRDTALVSWLTRLHVHFGSEADGPARCLRDVAHPTETANEPDQADARSLKSLVLWVPYRTTKVMSFGELGAKQRTTHPKSTGEVNRSSSETPRFCGLCGRDHRGGDGSEKCHWRRERHPRRTFSVFARKSGILGRALSAKSAVATG